MFGVAAHEGKGVAGSSLLCLWISAKRLEERIPDAAETYINSGRLITFEMSNRRRRTEAQLVQDFPHWYQDDQPVPVRLTIC